MRLGSEPAAESSRMARFADWFVASPVSAEYGITGLTDDEETIQDAEGERRNGKEVHGRNCLAVVAKKAKPALANIRASGCPPQPTRDGGLGYMEAEFK